MNRRDFLIGGAAASTFLSGGPDLFADPLGLPIGFQSYVVRSSIATDFAGTMKRLSAAGYTQVELCSPYGYDEFSSLRQYKPQQLRRMLADWGLGCISSHWSAQDLFQKADASIDYAHQFGMTQMAIAALGPFHSTTPQTMDDVKRYVEPFNAFAEKAHAAGIVALLHNEGFVSQYIDGKPVYDMMIAELNPATTQLQMQVSSWQQGYNPITYFHKYPGRYRSMHCQDWVKDPSTESGFRQVALGKGVVPWKAVFAAAKVGGIKNYFVELEENPALLAPSVPYLHSLNV